MEKIFLTTSDRAKIAADLYAPAALPLRWAVLVHMMPAVKESWRGLAEELVKAGLGCLAFDLRGHGQSATAPNLDYRSFSDEEHQKSILDLAAAADYLVKERGARAEKISFIGASIGANLALQCIAEHSLDKLGTGPELKTAVLLSPGLNYRGIKTEPLVKNLKAGQRVFFVAAEDDDDSAAESQKLYNLTPAGAEKKIRIYESGGHGTDIIESHPELKELIAEFIIKE